MRGQSGPSAKELKTQAEFDKFTGGDESVVVGTQNHALELQKWAGLKVLIFALQLWNVVLSELPQRAWLM